MNARAVVRHPPVAAVGAGSRMHAALLVQRGEARVFVPVELG